MSTSIEIDTADVLRIIQQFLKENGLVSSLNALQDESQISMNTVDNVDAFKADILAGNWDSVLNSIQTLRVPAEKLVELYEQIVLEMLELKETETAKAILRGAKPMNILKHEQPEKYLKLERMLQRSQFDAGEAYGGTKEKRRQHIAQSLVSEVIVVSPSRLMALMSQALKWQQYQGMLPPGVKFDLFRNTAIGKHVEDENFPTQLDKTIKFGKQSHAECAAFSPDGQLLVTGSSDGFVEVWNYQTGKLKKDLKYQADEEFMMHDEAVVSLAFSSDSDYLATGSQDGKIKVWQVASGKCVRKFESAHTKGVSHLCFARDGSQLLSGSFDNTVRVHGLKSGKTLKILRGHTSFVNCCIFAQDGTRIVSGSSDGTIKIWDTKSSECLQTINPASASGNATKEAAIHWIGLHPMYSDQLIVCNRSSSILIMSLKGQIIKALTAPNLTSQRDFLCCTTSRGDFLYAISDDGILHCFSLNTYKHEHAMKVHDKDALGMCHHPHINLLASWGQEGLLKLWKP